MSSLHTLLALVFPALLIVAALKDLTSFTIPNWISLALVAAFPAAALTGGMPMGEFGLHWAVGAGALVAGMAMFAVGWIGGGDAKVFAAASLWLGATAFLPYILVTALAGGGLALFLVAFRHSFVRAHVPVGPAWVERLREPKGSAPYGVAIAVGGLVALPMAGTISGLFTGI